MSILDQVSEEELMRDYTHIGWFGICPVYVGKLETDTPLLTERNWIPEWYFWLSEGMFGMYSFVMLSLDPSYEPVYAVTITGEIVKDAS